MLKRSMIFTLFKQTGFLVKNTQREKRPTIGQTSLLTIIEYKL
jgi:hypothetical protein